MTDERATPPHIKILAVSDQVDPRIHTASVRERMRGVNLVIGCGDVPARYLEFLADALDRPVYFVFGNHHEEQTRKGIQGKRYEPMGCVDMGGKILRDSSTGLILAGFPGSPRYSRETAQQYSNREISWMMYRMMPKLLYYRLRYGRYVDVLMTHAPPRHINDREDIPHRGFPPLRRFLSWFKPTVHLHGHIHIYDRNETVETPFCETMVINVYPYKTIELTAEQHTRPTLIRESTTPNG